MRRAWIAVLLLAGCVDAPTDPRPEPQVDADPDLLAYLETVATFPELRFETGHGTIRMVLYTAWTPQTAAHIGALTERGFYDGTLIHRVVDDFVIQGGDPSGTGEGGSGPLGTPDPVPLEIHPGLDFGSGAVGLARWTDDTGDSQWFITEKPALHLSRPSGPTGDVFGAYSLFGQVFAGMDVVRRIAAVDTIPQLDRPMADVVVHSAHLLPPPTDADPLAFAWQVVPGVAFEGAGDGTREAPRQAVADRPFTVRVTGASAADSLTMYARHAGGAFRFTLHAVAGDDATWEGNLTLPAGSYGLSPHADFSQEAPLRVDVAPWHGAYARFL